MYWSLRQSKLPFAFLRLYPLAGGPASIKPPRGGRAPFPQGVSAGPCLSFYCPMRALDAVRTRLYTGPGKQPESIPEAQGRGPPRGCTRSCQSRQPRPRGRPLSRLSPDPWGPPPDPPCRRSSRRRGSKMAMALLTQTTMPSQSWPWPQREVISQSLPTKPTKGGRLTREKAAAARHMARTGDLLERPFRLS